MVFYLDILKHLIRSDYWEGLRVVPIILISYLFQGIFFNLSLWYKLTDKTQYGAYFSIIGLIITILVNVIFVPRFGYMASAAASLSCFFAITLLSYFIGQKYYPIQYDFKSIFLYAGVTALFFAIHTFSPATGILRYAQDTLLLILFVALIVKRDLPLRAIPVVGKFFR
ncbi:MAG: polysaccharide biosynthesis C-terminal domain-containing protein, partial [Paludibacteraceae bacterium]|nr:polysaccharide biosynthesis C-terminal domain-containing protein [Paludibacteraceae bacterium]